jgi:hypothetical protein
MKKHAGKDAQERWNDRDIAGKSLSSSNYRWYGSKLIHKPISMWTKRQLVEKDSHIQND